MYPSTPKIGTSSIKNKEKKLGHEIQNFQVLLDEKGFHDKGKFAEGCYCTQVTSRSNDLPELINSIFPYDNGQHIWILAKGRLDKHLNEDQDVAKEDDGENIMRLANLG